MAKDKEFETNYKVERVRRIRPRKEKRKEIRANNKRYNHNSATWYENGRCMQNCEMGGTCEFPCNGDC